MTFQKVRGFRIVIFLVAFTLMNLSFIPLLALYGLRVCPVLSVPGFGFGCYYAGLYIGLTWTFNLIFLAVTQSQLFPKAQWMRRPSTRGWGHVGIYLFGTLAALLLLDQMLSLQHLSGTSRAPQILAFASVLLGISQAYGLNWALYPPATDDPITENKSQPTIQNLWARHIVRLLLPVVAMAAIILHFLYSQSVSFNEGSTAPLEHADKLIEQTSLVLAFLLAWLAVTLLFHFLSERDHLRQLETHFTKLRELNVQYRSPLTEAWGLWAAFLRQMNQFSQTLGERTRLLQNFSRFVTMDVAKQALSKELQISSGMARDLTVLMTDIRGFTAISETLPPDQLVELLNDYFSAMLEVISGYPISVDKFIGDGILAYVDTGNATEDRVSENRAAVDAALAMIVRLNVMNQKFKTRGWPALRIGVGILRGPLVIGFIGSTAKLQHTIIGDTVNRTARLESLSKDLGVQIVVPASVYKDLTSEQKAHFVDRGEQRLKGLTDQTHVYGGPIE